ncbi:DnaJ molecular chaperone y domain [Mactra antiquata]
MMPEGRAVVGVANQIFNGGLWGNLNICKLCQQKLIRTKAFVRLQSHYAVLGLTDKATQKEIREAYIELSKKEHPDQNTADKKSHERFVKINEAYNVLSKESSRLEYDNLLKNRGGPHRPGYQPGYSPQGFSQPGPSPYGQANDFYEHHQRFYGNSRHHGYEQYFENDSPFGANYEKRSDEDRIFEEDEQKFMIQIRMVHFVVTMLPFLLYGLYVHHDYEMAKAEEMSDTGKGLDFFKLVFKSCAALLVAGFLYESLQILSAYLKHRKREFQREFKKRNPTYVTQASADNQSSKVTDDHTGQQATRAIKLD